MKTGNRYFTILTALFIFEWMVLAIHPFDRSDWALENILVIVAVLILILVYKKLHLCSLSYTLIFCFLCLHQIGAHYTYAQVPYDDWYSAITGGTFNHLVGWERNQFDRVVHFLYGLLLAYPILEMFRRMTGARGFWRYFLPLNLIMATSMMFELFEWVTAGLFGGNLGQAYLGTQGDVWDAHKDMALASIGALIAMIITALINRYQQQDFKREWTESLRVKLAPPSSKK
jgi:putative membrane protein